MNLMWIWGWPICLFTTWLWKWGRSLCGASLFVYKHRLLHNRSVCWRCYFMCKVYGKNSFRNNFHILPKVMYRRSPCCLIATLWGVLMDNWMFITLFSLLVFKTSHLLCASLWCSGMHSIVSASSRCSVCKGLLFDLPHGAKLATNREKLLHPLETLHLCTPHSLCDQCTYTHTFIMLPCLSSGGSPREINLLMHLWCRLNENLAHHGF